ncbi:MAG: DUF1343 domain-containing protein, partial [Bacteroidetes bacterium]|nr:DUF1343 domain-containing protein [Bacteroidota bacterium]
KVFSPEHGFRGNVSDGGLINDHIDSKTGLSIISLYGSHKKPSKEDLSDIDIVIFDLQDVGVRFYTYLSTMTYVMEACAENNIPLIVFDRPNPNGFYVDGPVLKPEFKSFVGLHPIPIVHGLTPGEFALLVNGELWLANKLKCNLKIIEVAHYTHKQTMDLPVKPSPNLPTQSSVLLYPSLALFEGTVVSVGRGTPTPFEVIGHPEFGSNSVSFTPVSIPGTSVNPPLKNQKCYGIDLINYPIKNPEISGQIELRWIIQFYKELHGKTEFFSSYFEKLAGVATLRQQIEFGLSEEEIRKSWSKDLNKYKKIRTKYLLYPDFE